jgi:hypothetical protein
MLPQLRSYLMEHWDDLPGRPPPPTRLTFLGQATGVGKVCYFVFVDDEKRPRYIAKAPRSPVHNADLRREVAVIDELRARLPSDLCATLPGPMLTTELAGHAVVVEPVLPGRPLDGIGAAARPLDPATTERQLRLASDWLIAIQRAAPHRRERLADEDVQEHFLAPVEAFRRNADLTTTEERYLDGVTARARALVGQRLPLYLYHGDFRAGNILVDGDRLAVLDWQFYRPLAPPLLDWFGFAFRLYCHGTGTPDIDGPLDAYRTAFAKVFLDEGGFGAQVHHFTRLQCEALDVEPAHLRLLLATWLVTSANKFHGFLAERAQRGYLYLLKDARWAGRSYREQLRRQAYVWLLGGLAAEELRVNGARSR